MEQMRDISERQGTGCERTVLPPSVSNMLEEVRMTLPNSQTLFGFS